MGVDHLELSSLQILGIFVVSVICGLGSVIDAFQTHRPLIACTLAGLVLGDVTTGAVLGGTLEMMVLGWNGVDTGKSMETATLALTASLIVIGAGQSLGTGIAAALPLAAAAQVLVIFCRIFNVFFQHVADSFADDASISGVTLCHVGALLLGVMRVAVPVTLVAIYLRTDTVQVLLASIPSVVSTGLTAAAGFALALRRFATRDVLAFFVPGFVVAAFSDLTLLSVALFAFAAALVYVSLQPKPSDAKPLMQDVPADTKGKLGSGDLFRMFIRAHFLQGSWNAERLQGLGFCFALAPALKRFAEGDALKEALHRNLDLYASQPYLASISLGAAAAAEEQRAVGRIDGQTAVSTRAALMVPLAGIGEPLFWGLLRPLLAVSCASIALGGSIWGPVFFFVIFNVIRLAVLWFGLRFSYAGGLNMLSRLTSEGLRRFTSGISAAALIIYGAAAYRWTTLTLGWNVAQLQDEKGAVVTTTLQSIFDQIMPGTLPLTLIFLCLFALRRRVNSAMLAVILLVCGLLGAAVGFWH